MVVKPVFLYMPQAITKTLRVVRVKIKDDRTILRIEEPALENEGRDRAFLFRVNLPYDTPEEKMVADRFRQRLFENLS